MIKSKRRPVYGTYAYYDRDIKTTTPFVKGRNVGKIPVGQRERCWEQLRREGEDIVISYGDLDCLRFKKNGQVIINTGKWQYYTLIKFISSHLPWRTTVYMNRGAVCLLNDHGTFRIPNGENYALYSTMRPIKPVKEVRWYVNRKAMRKARATVTDFRKYVKLMFNLAGKEADEYMNFPVKEGLATITEAEQIVAALQGNDSEQWYAALQTRWTQHSIDSIDRMVTQNLIRYYGSKVIYKEVLPYGIWKREANKPPAK